MDDITSYQQQMAARVSEEQEAFPATPTQEDIGLDFIRDCLHNEERGDGIMFSRMQRDKFILVKNWGKDGQWLSWGGNHWIEDKLDLAHDAVEQIAQQYLRYSISIEADIKELAIEVSVAERALQDLQKQDTPDISEIDRLSASKHKAANKLGKLRGEQKKAQDRVDKLRRMGGAVNCLSWSHRIGSQSLSILGEEIDRNPWLLPCPNGVLDLRTLKFQPGRPADYLLKSIAVPWQGIDAPAPTWDAFFNEIHLEDSEVVAYLYRLFGYALTGLTTEHFLGFFLGEGRNGKGTMFEFLRYLMGDLGWAISPELLLEQKSARNSAGPSADLMSLHGRRIVIASESDENRRISLARVKQLTGADTITARAPHDRMETNISPTWKLFFYTNHVPSNIARDFAMRQRLVYLKYPLKFVDNPDPHDPYQRPKNTQLPDKLREEAPGILARFVRGCIEWQEMGGLHPPAKIRADVEELARTQDTFQQFFSEWIREEPGQYIAFKELYDRFSAWFDDEIGGQDKFRPTKMSVSKWLDKRGLDRRKPSGIATVYGIRFAAPHELC